MLDVVEQCRAADAAARVYDTARRAHQRAVAATQRARGDDAERAYWAERAAWRNLVAARDAWQAAWRAAEAEQVEAWAAAQTVDDQQGTLL